MVSCCIINPVLRITLVILLGISGIVFICGGAQYIDVHTYSFTECYPIEYSTEISVCYELNYRPQPVKAWIKFLFYNPDIKNNQTINYNLICGSSKKDAIDKAKEKYPYMKEIPCGIKTRNFFHIRIFLKGYPWDQMEIMVGAAVSMGILAILFGIVSLLSYRRIYRSV